MTLRAAPQNTSPDMSFELRHLRYAVAAAEHRSFFRAALALEIEQSSMSRNIVRLERRLGVKLFRRSHAGVSPTPAGAEFIRTARQILAKSEQLAAAMQSTAQGNTGRLTIGHSHSVPIERLDAILPARAQQFPDIEVAKIEGTRELLIAGLDAHVIDIAILPGDRVFAGLRQSRLWSEPLAQTPIHFSGYWLTDNDNPALQQFLDSVEERLAILRAEPSQSPDPSQ
jgi:DNA-binding transcriptional LysR family regulator